MSDRWIEVGDRAWVRRCERLDLSMGLVVGERGCLVIDTGLDADHGYEFAMAVRELTDLPWQIAYTHDHFDHWFGTAAFGEAAIWAVGDGASYVASGGFQRERWAAMYRREGREELARRLGRTRMVPPNCRVDGAVPVDLGGRTVVLRKVGMGHTDNDMVVEVPDAKVLFAGDLLEHGAPPQFGDAYPYHWPQALEYLLSWRPETVVPGHGDPADWWWARAQTRDLAEVARLCGEVASGLVTAEEAEEHSPFDAATMREAIQRAGAAASPSRARAASPTGPAGVPQAAPVIDVAPVIVMGPSEDAGDGD